MAKDDGFDGEIITEPVAASTSLSQVVDSQEPTEKDDNQQDLEKRKDKEESTNKLPYYKLYSFANFTDFLLIGVGTIGAIGNGMCMPFMTLLFGELVNAYGENEDTKKVVDEVSKVSLDFVFLAIAAGALGFLQMTCWIVTGERQAARIRSLYLKTMLRQDVGFFDTESHGEIIERMSGEILLIQDAMSEKVGKVIELGSTYISGFVIAFIKGWLLTFVLLSSVLPLFITGAIMNTVMAKMSSRGQAAYSVAATVSQQTIGAIRTVASFTGEKQAVAKYNESLTKAYKSSVQEGLAFGLGYGSISFFSYTTYALAVWFGGKMILRKGYSGGDAITALFDIMAGAYATEQASRSITAFGPGQAAAYKLFEAIKRKPQIDAYDPIGIISLRFYGINRIARTHSELTNDPVGAYSQLIRLQETSVVSEENIAKDHDGPEIVVNSGRNSSQRMSLTRSISRGSSGNGNISRHSFSVSFRIPTGIDLLELAPIEAEPLTSASESSEPPPEVPLSRLAYLSKPETPVLLLGTIAAVLIGLQLPVFGILLSGAIKSFFEPEDELHKHTKVWALLFFLLAISCLIVFPLRSYSFAVAGSKLIRRIRSMSFEKVVYMEISWFDEPDRSSGAIVARLSADAASFRRVVGDALGLLVQNIATIVAGLVIAFETNWEMALIVSVLLPLVAINGYIQMKYTQGYSADAKKMYEEASQVANDAIGSIRTVASFCAEEKVMKIYQKKCEDPLKASIRQGLAGGVAFGLSFCFLFLFYAGSFYFGVQLLDAGRVTFSEIFRVFYALLLAATGVSQSGFLAHDASKAMVAVASVFAILDRKSKIDSSDESGTTIESVKGDIELRHVSFTYPTRPDIKILKDLTLTIHSGKVQEEVKITSSLDFGVLMSL
ncbi:hypothetical protein Pint_20697 [Pistacia integerrima]|uniref:Uncharacterized protein n=1 Tax=Pistacia integerrima TaxID=434235 RepID=A0ACC0XB37_9ROSI|nr:hypothetical protein Pint_20697 [Pistacia integerrima]